MKHESPFKKQLEDSLVQMGEFATPEIRKIAEDAIAKLDHTHPGEVTSLLPPDTLAFYQHTTERAGALIPLGQRAHDAGCFIEAIILQHGLIQFALRGVFILAWQRALMPNPLSVEQLAPFYKHRSKAGDVHHLVEKLEENGLLQDYFAERLRLVNGLRNKAAHGVIFGEIVEADLAEGSRTCQWAALGALERLNGWFGNPQPLRILP
jgi:hypothetical protein